ncbi:MAG: DUF2071 domain-containing protein [Gloeobacteraceae cyanobacterium ES-bin-144]|nr:DUF2071 domain-containing protein [Verrucomicrobiales bacterium]
MPSNAQRLAARNAPPGFPVMRQRWSGLLFLHWPIDATMIQERLPKGLHVDTHEGQAWLGVVPFFMDRVRPTGLPPVPWLSWFMELNLRTYVHDDAGNPGVWFFSLDCNQPVAVEIARRAFHLPYQHATMRSRRLSNGVQYFSHRKTANSLEAEYIYQFPKETRPAEEGSLEWFLVERYLLFSSNPAGEIFCGRVHHAPYQIAPAQCERWSTEPIRANGYPVPKEPPPSMWVASPVDVRIYPLRRI